MAIGAGEVLFLDTNVLLSATDLSRQEHASALRLLSHFRRGGFHLAASGQVIREYLVVATRPLHANGLGLCPADALRNAEELTRRIFLLDETEAVSLRLRSLMAAREVAGSRIHDVNIVATMLTHAVSTLVTQNAADFAGFPEITLLDIAGSDRLVSGQA